MGMDKTSSRKITVAEMAPHVHSFLPNENKVEKISNYSLVGGKIQLEDGFC